MLRKLDGFVTMLGRQWRHWAFHLVAEGKARLRAITHAAPSTAMGDEMDGMDPSRCELAL